MRWTKWLLWLGMVCSASSIADAQDERRLLYVAVPGFGIISNSAGTGCSCSISTTGTSS